MFCPGEYFFFFLSKYCLKILPIKISKLNIMAFTPHALIQTLQYIGIDEYPKRSPYKVFYLFIDKPNRRGKRS